jgi:hypothetical protein
MSKSGDVVGNFMLSYSVTSLNNLVDVLNSNPSICWRGKMYPSSFISHWSLHRLMIEVKYGNFWYAVKIQNNESKSTSVKRKKCDWCDKYKVEYKLTNLGKGTTDKEYRICDECNYEHDVY